MRSLFLSTLIFFISFGGMIASAEGYLTDGDDISTGLSLGLDLADAIADKKDIVEGVKEVAESKYDDWIWDSIGGYEKFWKGQVDDTDAYVNQAKDAIDEVLDIIEKVQELGTKLGEGKYDEALFIVVDKVVDKVDHPVVKVAWTAIKLAYESHKAVLETGAALQIEALYGAMSNDRRLLGTIDPDSDSPKLIPENAATADYFFNKYIVTNDHTRAMVKAYVVNVIGDEWPERSWGDWVEDWKAIGSGEDTERSAEIRALSSDFRNKARTWIMRIIKDVNEQARTAWAEVKVRKEMYAFQAFAERLKAFSGDLPNLLREFKSKKKYREELPEYKVYLAKSPEALRAAEKLIEKPEKRKLLLKAIETWKSRLVRASSACYLIGEAQLSTSLKEQLKQWWNLEDRYQDALESLEETIVNEPVQVYEEGEGVVVDAEVAQYYKDLFELHLGPFKNWSIHPNNAAGNVLMYLNRGNFEKASEAWSEFNSQDKVYDSYYSDISDQMRKVFKVKKSEYTEQINELRAEKQRLLKERGDIQTRIDEASTSSDESLKESCYQEQRNNTSQMAQVEEKIKELNGKIASCKEAWILAEYVNGSFRDVTSAMVKQANTETKEVWDAFEELKDLCRSQWFSYNGSVRDVEQALPIKAITGEGPPTWSDSLLNRRMALVKKAFDEIKNDQYTGIGSFKKAKIPVELLVAMSHRIDDIKDSISHIGTFLASSPGIKDAGSIVEGAKAEISSIKKSFENWDQAAKEMERIPKLTNKAIKEIQVLVKPDKFKERLQEIELVRKAAQKVPDLTKKLKKKFEELYALAKTKEAEGQADIEWVITKQRQVRAFLLDQEDKNILKKSGDDYRLILQEEDGMLISDTPFRHYMTAGEIKTFSGEILAGWEGYPGFKFIKSNASGVYKYLTDLLRLPEIKSASEDNVIVRTGEGSYLVIWASALPKLDEAVKALKYDDSDIKFEQAILGVTQVEGMAGVLIPSDAKVKCTVTENYKSYEKDYENTLGKEYIKILESLQKVFDEREKYLEKHGSQPAGPGTPGEPGSSGPDGPGDKPEGPGVGPRGPGGTEGMGVRVTPGEFGGFYQIYDARVNTVSLRNASGDVILTNSEMRQGYIEITARLSTMQRVQKLLISVNDGRTWNELTVNQSIRYQFMPIPNRRYQPVIKVLTVDADEIPMKVFPNVNCIMYKDIDYSQLITETVRKISEAYETKNIALFSDYVSRDFLGNKTYLMEGVRFDFDMFTDIRLIIFINRIDQGGGIFTAETKWDKTQTPRTTMQQQRTSGRTNMVFAMEDGKMKITNLRGNLIYATLSPEIAESSGLPSETVEEIRVAQITRTPVQPGAGETEESGGVSSSISTQNGTITSTPPPPAPPDNFNSFDFSAGAEGGQGVGDIYFWQLNQFTCNGTAQIQEVTGTSTFDNLDEAPASGYGNNVAITNGDVFVIITREGYYGKIRITSLTNNMPVNYSVTFEYALQTDGSRNINTQ